jgi:hypothetical protein
VALVIIAIYHFDEVARASGSAGFLPIANPMQRGLLFEFTTMLLAAAAFLISWKRPSIIIPMLLVVAAALMVIDGIAIGTKHFTILTLPGPILGPIYGFVVFALGVGKGDRSCGRPEDSSDYSQKTVRFNTDWAKPNREL